MFAVKLVYENTVGQYTGFVDPKGNRIFEGDILKNRYHTFLVVYDDNRFIGTSSKLDVFDNDRTLVYIGSQSLEVIGNIYDNPELLEKIVERKK